MIGKILLRNRLHQPGIKAGILFASRFHCVARGKNNILFINGFTVGKNVGHTLLYRAPSRRLPSDLHTEIPCERLPFHLLRRFEYARTNPECR